MTTLFLLCGLPGSGKTTLAKELERQRQALRLSPDEWLLSLGIDLYDESQRAKVEALQWDIAKRALTLGIDIILEFGFWSRKERDYYRCQAETLGARVEVRFLDVSRDELRARIRKRNAGLTAETGRIDEASLDLWCTQFEPPTPDELTRTS